MSKVKPRPKVLEYRVKYLVIETNKVLYGYVYGFTEEDCWKKACAAYGKNNIFDFART